MIDPIRATWSTGLPVSIADSHPPSARLAAPSTQVPPNIRLQQLCDSALPPCDHHEFKLPEKTAGDGNSWKRLNYDPGSTYLGHMIYMAQQAPPTVTREVALAFMNDGQCPAPPREFKALALYLLSNRLFSALTWLLVHSATDLLALDKCKMGNEGAGKLAEWLTSIPLKVKVNLRENEIDSLGAAFLASALAADTVVELNLGFNPLGEEGAQVLCTGLLQNASMVSLDLRHVGAECAGMKAIALVLDSHPSLSVLRVDSNTFDDDTAAVFAIALGRSKILTELDMHLFNASDNALALVATALKVNTSMKSLSISGALDEPYELLFNAVADGLISNGTLAKLALLADYMSDAALKKLALAVEKNSALRSIGLNLIGHEDSSETAAANRRIRDKVKENALIEAAGQALSELSKRPEWPVPVPDEVGQSIAAFVAQVAAGDNRKEAMRAIVKAGPLG